MSAWFKTSTPGEDCAMEDFVDCLVEGRTPEWRCQKDANCVPEGRYYYDSDFGKRERSA